jgi:hypothetical protein
VRDYVLYIIIHFFLTSHISLYITISSRTCRRAVSMSDMKRTKRGFAGRKFLLRCRYWGWVVVVLFSVCPSFGCDIGVLGCDIGISPLRFCCSVGVSGACMMSPLGLRI